MSDWKPTTGVAIPPERIAAARALYEANPNKTLNDIANETNISIQTLKRYSSADGWKKTRVKDFDQLAQNTPPANTDPNVSDFDRLTEEYKKKLPANPTPVVQEAVADQLVLEQAVKERQRVLERHREELNLPRKLAYQAVQTNNFDTAKLAKISSETLRNVQDMERKAWGIDHGQAENNITVVIERG
ncbi:hypothetical protein NAD41_002375 [Salmonella enterica]|nr:hypothetical protein [Salmonella enterica]EKK6596343.1 hypothetical protein [Salmonella enterica]